jgi:hypothetical protein
LRNLEIDAAGRLAAFRERYGRSFDLERPQTDDDAAAAAAAEGEEGGLDMDGKPVETESTDLLGDLIASQAVHEKAPKGAFAEKSKKK